MASYLGTTIVDILTSRYVPTTSTGQTDSFNLSNGTGSQLINNVKIKNIYGDYVYSDSVQSTLFDDITADDTFMCVRVFHGSLNVTTGTLQPSVRTRGMILLVKGNVNISAGAKISMTAKGANATSENVYFATNGGTVQYIGATGAIGGSTNAVSGSTQRLSGQSGTSGTTSGALRKTGGGGSGSSHLVFVSAGSANGGAGSTGTSYAGGNGGGGVYARNTTLNGNNATASTGGAGAMSFVSSQVSGSDTTAGGGAGIAGGAGRKITAGTATSIGTAINSGAEKGSDGAGGLLILICYNSINNSGTIESKGSDGGAGTNGTGGGSGGGSINILYRGTVSSNLTSSTNYSALGIAGGAGPTQSTNTSFKAGDGGSAGYAVEAYTTSTRQTLFKVGSNYYYYNFTSGQWVQATDSVTTEQLFRLRGMFDGELLNLDRSKIAQLVSNGLDLSAVTIQTYVTT